MDFLAIWNAIKPFLVGMLVRWLLVIGGTVFASAGFSEEKLTEFIGGLLAIIVSLIISVVQHKNAVEATPPK